MDRLHLMAVYVAVAEVQGFAGAARKLGMSAPAVTRAVAALEARLGVQLLQRTTRHVRVTEAGQRYLDDARRVLAAADEADEAAAGSGAMPRGHVAITAPVLFGRLHVMPLVAEYLAGHAAVSVSALLLDRNVNLLEEGVDIAVRIGPLADSSMRAIEVGQVRRMVCAAPGYLAAHGTPASPDDLHRHAIIAAGTVAQQTDWPFAGQRAVRLQPRLAVSSNDSAIDAARRGLGIVRLMSYQLADDIAAGALQPLLGAYEEAALPVHVLHREHKAGLPKVRGLIDLLVTRLRADTRLNA